MVNYLDKDYDNNNNNDDDVDDDDNDNRSSSSSSNDIFQDDISSWFASSRTVPTFRTNNKESKISNIFSQHMKADNFQRKGQISVYFKY